MTHPALVERDHIRRLRDRLKERQDRALGVLASRAARTSGEPHDGGAGMRGLRPQPNERELDHGSIRAGAVLEYRQVPELGSDRRGAVVRLEPDGLETEASRRDLDGGGGV